MGVSAIGRERAVRSCVCSFQTSVAHPCSMPSLILMGTKLSSKSSQFVSTLSDSPGMYWPLLCLGSNCNAKIKCCILLISDVIFNENPCVPSPVSVVLTHFNITKIHLKKRTAITNYKLGKYF